MISHEPGPTTRPTTAGRTIWSRGLMLWLGALTLWFTFSSTVDTLASDVTGSTTDRAVQIVFWALIYLAIWWRGAMVRVTVTQDGLVVRNVWRTHRIAWEEIRAFEPQRRGLLHRTAAVLQDGRWVPLSVVTLYRDASSGWGVRQTELLRAERMAALHGRSIDEAAETVASASDPTSTAPLWARIVLPVVVLLVGVILVAPGLLVAGPALAILIGGALLAWRALGGVLDARAAPLLTAAGIVVVLRVLVELAERTG